MDALANLAAGKDVRARPLVTRIERHEFDEAHFHVVFTREDREVDYFIFVVTTHDHGIDLYRFESSFLGCAYAGKHFVQNVDAGHSFEDVAL